MQIMIIAGGSRGDVQPYVALGVGLQAAGHTVRILAPMNFRELITAHGLEFFAMNDLTEAMTQERARELAEQGNLLKMLTAQGRCAAPCLALLGWPLPCIYVASAYNAMLAVTVQVFLSRQGAKTRSQLIPLCDLASWREASNKEEA
jgi:hypothetical protein